MLFGVGGDKMYNEMYEMVMQKFSAGKIFALATLRNGHPTVRTMSGFSLNGKIYFQTDSLMEKAADIRKNNQVALCVDEIQIQGSCVEIGHPLDNANSWFADMFKAFFPKAYAQYSHVKTERVYEMTPVMVKIWGKQKEVPALIYLKVDNKNCEIKIFEEY